jgi:methylated-DNA-[protein]-cysteine S-methyltransferase
MKEQRTSETLYRMADVPSAVDVARSRQDVDSWFALAAPLIWWNVVESPIGPLHLAASSRGLCRVDFFGNRETFLASLDPLARTEHNSDVLAPVEKQLAEYFSRKRSKFDLAIDLEPVPVFQRNVLQTALGIPAGTVWTYQQVAQAIGKPTASRAVGQALGHNPVPIIIPCHRVVGSDGSLHGYAGGLERKRVLLQLEGAL